MRLDPPPEVEEEPGPVLEGLHPRDGAGLPQADDRAARGRSSPRPGEALIDGARYVDERLVEIFDELEPGRDRRGQRRRVPGPARVSGRPWVRIVSCNPLELKDPELPPTFSGYPIDRPSRWDEFRARVPASCTSRCRPSFSAFCERARRAAAARDRVHPRVAVPQPLPLSGARSTTSARSRSARPGTTSTRACAPIDAACRSRRARRRRARSSTSASARLGSADVDADEPPRRRARRDAAPLRRLEGPPARASRAAPNMTGAEFLPQPRSCRRSTS